MTRLNTSNYAAAKVATQDKGYQHIALINRLIEHKAAIIFCLLMSIFSISNALGACDKRALGKYQKAKNAFEVNNLTEADSWVRRALADCSKDKSIVVGEKISGTRGIFHHSSSLNNVGSEIYEDFAPNQLQRNILKSARSVNRKNERLHGQKVVPDLVFSIAPTQDEQTYWVRAQPYTLKIDVFNKGQGVFFQGGVILRIDGVVNRIKEIDLGLIMPQQKQQVTLNLDPIFSKNPGSIYVTAKVRSPQAYQMTSPTLAAEYYGDNTSDLRWETDMKIMTAWLHEAQKKSFQLTNTGPTHIKNLHVSYRKLQDGVKNMGKTYSRPFDIKPFQSVTINSTWLANQAEFVGAEIPVNIDVYQGKHQAISKRFDIQVAALPLGELPKLNSQLTAWPMINLGEPVPVAKNKRALAVVIGVEDYAQIPSPVKFAKENVDTMVHAFHKGLGIPMEHIIAKTNISYAEIRQLFSADGDVAKKLRAINGYRGRGQLFVYFSGHGAPDINDQGKSMIALADTSLYQLENTALPLSELSQWVNKLPTSSRHLWFDSCFSGLNETGRLIFDNVSPVLIPSLAIKRQVNASNNNFFFAATNQQFAQSDDYLKSGVFTYYLSKGLLGAADTDKNRRINVNELVAFVQDKMNQNKGAKRHRQTPVGLIKDDEVLSQW
jgi:hypothetical protein